MPWSRWQVRAFLPQSGKLLYVARHQLEACRSCRGVSEAINDAHKNGVTALALSSDCGRIAPRSREPSSIDRMAGDRRNGGRGACLEHRLADPDHGCFIEGHGS